MIAVGTKDDFTGDWAIKEITKQNKDFKAGFLKIEAGKVMLGTTEIEVNKTFKNDEIGAFAAINGSELTVRLKGVKQAETTVGAWASKEVKVKIVKQ